MRVAILDDIHNAYEHTSGVRRLRERTAVRIFTGPFGDPSELSGFDAVVANRERTCFTRALLEQLPDLRVIAQTGNHANHIDFAAVRKCGIAVLKATGGYSIGAAELTIGLAIALTRQMLTCDSAVKQGAWPQPTTPVLYGKTFGIVGFGQVGRHVAKIAAAFGMRVLAWGPRLTDVQAAAASVELLPLDDLLQQADIVSIHASLKPESRGLIDRRRISLMKRTAYLINTARGPIVDETALVTALVENRIAGAGLDVFDEEPLPVGHPLTRASNVILTPHIGWPTDMAYERFSDCAADSLIAYLDGGDVQRFTA